MPVNAKIQHEALARLPAALQATMKARGHTQAQVAALCDVPQPQISRALRSRRKRLTPPMVRLCQYAELTLGTQAEAQTHAALAAVDRLLRQRPEVAPLLNAWIEAWETWADKPSNDHR